MMKVIVALLALLACASAFAPSQTAFVRKTTTALDMAKGEPNKFAAAAAGLGTAFLTSTAAMATEGTGEMFGIDDTRQLVGFFVVHWAILSLWYSEYGQYDEENDFFGEIDYTEKR